jgi:acyl-CoA thioester hydrolase
MLQTKIEIRIRYAETDMMGFAHHGNYAAWFELARVRMMDEFGYPYREMESDGFHLPVLEMHTRFQRSVTFDDIVAVEATLREKPSARVRIEYRVLREDREVASGSTLHAFINTEGRPVRPPRRFSRGMEAVFAKRPD